MPDFNPGFGRRVAVDARDSRFPMRLMLDPLRNQYFPRGIPPGNRHYWQGPILDQSFRVSTRTCVAHAGTAKINAAPIMQQMTLTPYEFYRRIVLVDEWSDNDGEATAPDEQLQFGTSVRACAKTLVSLGYAKSYLWAESAEDVRAWILSGFGGVIMGTTWKSDMMRTDAQGFVSFTGGFEGGHAYYVNGVNDRVNWKGQTVSAFRCMNSWGRSWGQAGRFWISYDDLEKAISDQGEACALTEQRL